MRVFMPLGRSRFKMKREYVPCVINIYFRWYFVPRWGGGIRRVSVGCPGSCVVIDSLGGSGMYSTARCLYIDYGTPTSCDITIGCIGDCITVGANNILWERFTVRMDKIRCRACRWVSVYKRCLIRVIVA